MGAERLVFLTDVSGIYDGEGRVISRLTAADALDLMSSGAIDEGMVPKLDSCLKALSVTDDVRVVDGRVAHALLHEMEGGVGGTTVAR
jgi:acetylglutamate kinase